MHPSGAEPSSPRLPAGVTDITARDPRRRPPGSATARRVARPPRGEAAGRLEAGRWPAGRRAPARREQEALPGAGAVDTAAAAAMETTAPVRGHTVSGMPRPSRRRRHSRERRYQRGPGRRPRDGAAEMPQSPAGGGRTREAHLGAGLEQQASKAGKEGEAAGRVDQMPADPGVPAQPQQHDHLGVGSARVGGAPDDDHGMPYLPLYDLTA